MGALRRKLSLSLALSALSAVLAAFLLSCDQDESAFRPEDEDSFVSSLAGRVTDRQGRSLEGALVTASPSGGSALSGEDGSFRLSGLVAGSYRVSVARHDYRDTMWLDSARLGLSAVQSVGTIAMRFRYAVVEGVVVDSGGSVRSGAGVSVENQTSESVSAGKGAFALSRVQPGRVRLFAALAGTGYGMLDTVVGSEDTLRGVKLRLDRRGGTVEGRIVGSDAKGLEGVVVRALGGALETRTNPDGTYRLTEVPGAGSVALEIVKGGAATTVTGVRVAEGAHTELPDVALASTVGTGTRVRPGVAIAFTTDSVVVLVAETASEDSTFRVLRHLWSVDGGRTWDTTSSNIRMFLPKLLGWTGGTRSVLARSISADGRVSSTGIISVRIVPPPDWTPPVVARRAPETDTVFAWRDSVVSVSWSVSDDRKLGIVKIDSLLVGVENDVARRILGIPVGTTIVRLWASDSSGNVSCDSLRLTRREQPDTVAPRVARLSPRSDTIRAWKDSVATVSWSVDDDRRLDSVEIDGTTAEVDSGRVSRRVVLPVGKTTVRLWARDSAGNVSRDTLWLTRNPLADTTAPTLTRIVPKSDTSYAWEDSVATASWSVVDDRRLDSVAIDGTAAELDSGRVSRRIVLPVGKTMVRLWARDSAGNVSRDSLILVREVLPPADSTLRALSVGSGVLRPAFRSDSLRYRDTVDFADTAIRIGAVPNDTVDGSAAVAGAETGRSWQVRLGDPGTTTRIRVVSRGRDGDSLEYVLDVHRRPRPSFGIPWNEGVEYGLLRDERDGMTYRTVRIGARNWMAENLAHVVDSSWCPHDSVDSCAKYGRLYQWPAALALSPEQAAEIGDEDDSIRQGICPRGWHVPSRGEWTALAAAVESDGTVGKGGGGTALKSTAGWDESGVGTDRFGFRAMGSGYRVVDFGPTGRFGYFWSSSADGTGYAWMRVIYYNYAQLYEASGDKNAGYSLRCVEDVPDTSTALRSLVVGAGRLSPAFHPDSLSYVDSVSLRNDSISIVAEAASGSATVSIDGDGKVSLATDSVISVVVVNGERRRVHVVRVFHIPADSTNGIAIRDDVSHGVLRDQRDGKEYRTVRIGAQNWMAENLNHARDSSWCPGGVEDSCDKYGRLYSWSSAMGIANSWNSAYWSGGGANVQGACPDGWHVPDSSEWALLQNTVASDARVASGAAGAALKSRMGWADAGAGTDLFGFRAIPAGYRYGLSTIDLGQVARFWSSTQGAGQDGLRGAHSRAILAALPSLGTAGSAKTLGLSVRCTEDPPDTSTALSSLVVGAGTLSPVFSPTRTNYVDTVASSVRTLSVSATAYSRKATVSIDGDGDVDLAKDSNVTISVSNGGRTRVYVIRVAHFDSSWGIPWNWGETYGVLRDARDGKEYRTVRIGDQNWMAENLNHEGPDSSWCYGGSADSCEKYGRLYPWTSAMGFASVYDAAGWDGNDSMFRGNCPSGWHLPNASEWGTLVKTVEADPRVGVGAAGGALKSSRGWRYASNGKDQFGFRLLPAGGRYNASSDHDAGLMGESWSSTSDPSRGMVSYQAFSYDDGTDYLQATGSSRKDGRSVRCVEDPADTSTSLRALVVGQGALSPAFLPSRLSYVDSVDPEIATLRVEARAASAKATVSIDGGGNVSLATDSVVSVSVSNGGARRVYEIRVFHRANDSTWGVPWNSGTTYGVLHDSRDNKEYRTVRIGGRNWMAENLEFARDSSWCHGGSADTCRKYGRLYTWAAAMDLVPAYGKASWRGDGDSRRGVCPSGWHLPDDVEWTGLAAAVASGVGSGAVGTALKSGAGWEGTGSDASGFRGLPAGYRVGGEFFAIRSNAYFWSSTEHDSAVAWTHLLVGNSADLTRLDLGKENAFSVRCVEDLPDTTTRLRSLSVSRGTLTPAFQRDVLSYVDTVESDATTLSVSAVAVSGGASVAVDGGGAATLATDSVVSVDVSNGGSRRVYEIRVFHRAPPLDTTWGIPWNESVAYGVLRDARDGQEYRTVTIGSQTWMAENLNRVVDDSWCAKDSCGKYGRYYSWSAAMGVPAQYDTIWWLGSSTRRQGACPDGWHVPKATEWGELVSEVQKGAVGVGDSAGIALRSVGWRDSYTSADKYGFRALPAGYRLVPSYIAATFWTSSQYEWHGVPAWFRMLGAPRSTANLASKVNGLSLRCLKD